MTKPSELAEYVFGSLAIAIVVYRIVTIMIPMIRDATRNKKNITNWDWNKIFKSLTQLV